MSQGEIKMPKLLEQKIVYDQFFTIEEDLLRYPEGHEHTYYSIKLPKDAVIVLATDTEGKFLVLQEYRHPTKEIVWGLPGGLLDEGEDHLDCAIRELKEETGCEAEEWAFMGSSYPYAGVSNQKTHFYRAWGAERTSSPSLDPTEALTAHFLSPKELAVKIQTEPVDGLLLSALHLNSLVE